MFVIIIRIIFIIIIIIIIMFIIIFSESNGAMRRGTPVAATASQGYPAKRPCRHTDRRSAAVYYLDAAVVDSRWLKWAGKRYSMNAQQ